MSDTAIEVIADVTRIVEVVGDQHVIEVVTGQQGPPGPAGPANTEYVDDLMTTHLMDPTPHQVYDDAPSFTLLFENGLV